MSNIFITFFAYLLDKFFGEFRFIEHPVSYIKRLITFFENRYYKKDVKQGVYLLSFILLSVGFFSILLQEFLSYLSTLFDILLSSFIASLFISHKLLYDSLKKALHLESSDAYKTAIEEYAKKLNKDVVAPMLYLVLFGLPGIIIYTSIKTLDSMVGYKTAQYEKYGKASALLDDAINYIPARFTAVLIMFFGGQKDVFSFYTDGQKHESPNTGHTITAMALVLGIKLGGNISKHGKKKKIPILGKGRKIITEADVKKALSLLNQ